MINQLDVLYKANANPKYVDRVEDDCVSSGGLLQRERGHQDHERLEGVRLHHRGHRLLQARLDKGHW